MSLETASWSLVIGNRRLFKVGSGIFMMRLLG